MVRSAGGCRGGVGEGVLSAIARAVGTPVYVYDAAEIRRRYARLTDALAGIPHRVCYAVKANGSLAVLGVMRELGAGLDIVSGGELARALRCGFPPRDLVFSGVGKTPAELRQAVERGIGLLNVESAGELDVLGGLTLDVGREVRVGLRVNPDVTTETHPYTRTGERGMKFGVPLDEVPELAARIWRHEGLRLVCIGMHIGSQILDSSRYREGAGKLAALVEDVRGLGVETLETVDVGGGLGIRYTNEEPLEPEAFADAVRPLWDTVQLPLTLEPGRCLLGNAGTLLTACLYRKHSGGRDFVIVDAGMTELLRPTLYQAVHRIEKVEAERHRDTEAGAGSVDIVGPICETGDFLGLGRDLPDVASGDLLAVRDAGAYGFVMSSNYNSRPRPAEVLVDGERWAVIRDRETTDDLTRGEKTLEEIEWNG